MSQGDSGSRPGGADGGGAARRKSGPPPLPGKLPPARTLPVQPAGVARLGGAAGAGGMSAVSPPPPPMERVARAMAKAEKRLARPELREDEDPSVWPLAWLVAIAIVPLAAFFQQYTLWLGSSTLENAPEALRTSEAAHPPEVSELVINGKFVVKMMHFMDDDWDGGAWPEEEWPEEEVEEEGDGEVVYVEEEDWRGEIMTELEPLAVSRTERLQLAILAGELQGAEAALARLNKLGEEVTAGGALAGDVHWLKRLYREGPRALDESVKRSLVARHGWFGELALSFNAPSSDPLRWKVVSGFGRILMFMGATTVSTWLLFLFGVVLLVALGVIAGKQGLTLHFEPPEPGGSVYLETFTVFVGGFVLFLSLFLFLFGLHAEGTTTALIMMEVVTWGLFITVLYPIVVAKTPIRRVLHDLGLHRGEGVLKEVWCGFVGHVAGIPLSSLLIMIMLVFAMISGGGEEEATQGLEGYPMFESPAGDTWLYVWIGAASTVIWAPLLEEIMFRGALYRYLRSIWRVPLAALVSAAVFGAVHPYTTSGLIQVGFSGLVFAALREWRGSLIAPITAHALHNGTITFMQVGMLMVID